MNENQLLLLLLQLLYSLARQYISFYEKNVKGRDIEIAE